MNLFRSLRWTILSVLSGMLIILVVTYSMVAGSYFLSGADVLSTSLLYDTANRYQDKIDSGTPFNQPDVLNLSLYSRYEDLPRVIRSMIDADEIPFDTLQVLQRAAQEPVMPGVYFRLKTYTPQHNIMYVLSALPPNQAPHAPTRALDNKFRLLFILGGLVLALGLGILVLLYRITSSPIQKLLNWTRALSPETLQHPIPNFRFDEINQLASVVHASLNSSQEALEREHSFLRHASHELRTPLAITRSNLELLTRFAPPTTAVGEEALERIVRSTHNMQQMIETLLWLSRDEDYYIENQQIDLCLLIQQELEKQAPLAQQRQLSIETDLHPCTRQLPRVPSQIVISNLIRNACEHSYVGTITIKLSSSGELEIGNQVREESDPIRSEENFGLGLELVKKLAQRFEWPFCIRNENCRWETRLQFVSMKQSQIARSK